MGSLKNIGNSCYMNAVLYALRFTPTFLHNLHHLIVNILSLHEEIEVTLDSCSKSKATKLIKSGNWSKGIISQENIDIVRELHNVFVNLASSARNGARQQSNALQKSIHATNDTFIPLTQQDSHEFLMFVLNCLRDCSTALIDLVQTHPDKFEGIDNPASKLCLDYFRKTFIGQRSSMTRCLCCESEQTQCEEMVDLFVTILPGCELDGNFIRNSCVTKERFDSKIKCSECCRLTQSVQTTTFPHLPRILIVQLGRFESQLKKVNTAAPTLYRLNCFCSACEKLPDGATNENHQYRLYCVIVHIGRTSRSGHYMAYARSTEEGLHLDQDHGCKYDNCCKLNLSSSNKDGVDETVNHNWYICNDDTITKVSQSDFDAKVTNEATRKTPYILFYGRNDLAG